MLGVEEVKWGYPKFQKKIKHTELLYFWMRAVLEKFSTCCMRHWIQRFCWILWIRNLLIYLLRHHFLIGKLSPAFPQGCLNKTHCVHTAQPQRRKTLQVREGTLTSSDFTQSHISHSQAKTGNRYKSRQRNNPNLETCHHPHLTKQKFDIGTLWFRFFPNQEIWMGCEELWKVLGLRLEQQSQNHRII